MGRLQQLSRPALSVHCLAPILQANSVPVSPNRTFAWSIGRESLQLRQSCNVHISAIVRCSPRERRGRALAERGKWQSQREKMSEREAARREKHHVEQAGDGIANVPREARAAVGVPPASRASAYVQTVATVWRNPQIAVLANACHAIRAAAPGALGQAVDQAAEPFNRQRRPPRAPSPPGNRAPSACHRASRTRSCSAP